MREIKFNAVDEDTNEYIKYDDWLENNRKHHDEGHEPLSRFLESYYGFELLQYTGLKDKNGVNIFEGDIVKRCVAIHQGNTKEYLVGRVYYEEPCFVIEHKFESHIKNNFVPLRHPNCCLPIGDEVIGNIWENKGLLDD